MLYNFFVTVFVVLAIACVILRWMGRAPAESNEGITAPRETNFKLFQKNYLIVYLVAMGADWLQGPYVYALYESYGFEKSDIGILFIAGFLSSAVFGTFVGGLADKYGRKRLSLLFGVFYGISCVTKLFNDFNILLLGRVLSGISTSLLFSVFEAWMVSEHRSRGYSTSLLSNTFSLATFGNGIIAIGAGLAATVVADLYGYVAPFMLALLFLIAEVFIVSRSWVENYGDEKVDVVGTFTNAWTAITNDYRILLLGLIQSLFEASMYTFVFMWTPALKSDPTIKESSEILPFGLIFACYMVSIMIGSFLFSILVTKMHMSSEEIGGCLLAMAAMAMVVPIYFVRMDLVLASFIVFEICCGLYFPCFGTLRSKYIPEETRAAVMNFVRVPLNLLVVIVLVKVGTLQNHTVFTICSLWLTAAFLLHYQFKKLPQIEKQTANELLD